MTDLDAHQVAELVNRHGIDQVDASRIVYSGLPPLGPAPSPAWTVWIRQQITAAFAPLRELVGLR